MDFNACGAMLLLAGLAGAPDEVANVELPDDVAAFAPVVASRSAEAAAVSFRFLTREEGHEILLSDVHVTIRHPVEGTLVDAVSNGPFLVAFIPAGRYDVTASYEGKLRHTSLTIVRAEPRNVSLYW